jgi:hypothetical protein
MSTGINKQQGMTLISWMIVIAIALFFILVGIKMVPSYLENYSIRHILAEAEDDRRFRDMTRGEMKKTILKRFKVNGIYNFNKDDLKLKAGKGGTDIKVDYEVRKPVAGNVEVVMSFSESAFIRQ